MLKNLYHRTNAVLIKVGLQASFCFVFVLFFTYSSKTLRDRKGETVEERGWVSGYTQWCRRGDPTDPASPPVYPTSPMCAPRDDNHNTPEPPPSGKKAGLRLQPIRTRELRVSNLWGGRGRAGGGRGVVGEGPRPWEARTCRVQGDREAERRQASRT